MALDTPQKEMSFEGEVNMVPLYNKVHLHPPFSKWGVIGSTGPYPRGPRPSMLMVQHLRAKSPKPTTSSPRPQFLYTHHMPRANNPIAPSLMLLSLLILGEADMLICTKWATPKMDKKMGVFWVICSCGPTSLKQKYWYRGPQKW